LTVEHPSLAEIFAGVLTALLVFASPVCAQRKETSLDAGAVALRYADTLNAGAATITPRAAAQWARGAAEVTGTYSQFTTGGWSAQGALSGSLFAPTASGFLAEVAGFAGGSTHHDGTRTGQVLANGRLHFMRTRGELFLGAGGGRTWVGGGSRSVFLGEAGMSSMIREVDATLTASPTMVEDSIKYVDGQLSLFWARERLDLGALIGTRFGDQLTSLGGTAKTWGNLTAVASLTPRFALVVSGGTYPIDPTQGFPGGRFVSASIRLATRRVSDAPLPQAEQARAGTGDTEGAPTVTSFVAERGHAGRVTLRVKAPLAQLVEVSGDFTNWTPVRLERASDGLWSGTFPISRGKYQLNLRLDGGKWLVPPGLLSMLDEFGGSVGLLVIE